MRRKPFFTVSEISFFSSRPQENTPRVILEHRGTSSALVWICTQEDYGKCGLCMCGRPLYRVDTGALVIEHIPRESRHA